MLIPIALLVICVTVQGIDSNSHTNFSEPIPCRTILYNKLNKHKHVY